MIDVDYGHIEIQIDKLLEEKGISKNKLARKAEMEWKQLNKYCQNTITRLDVLVLCKLCTVLDCKIEDLLVFYPPEK